MSYSCSCTVKTPNFFHKFAAFHQWLHSCDLCPKYKSHFWPCGPMYISLDVAQHVFVGITPKSPQRTIFLASRSKVMTQSMDVHRDIALSKVAFESSLVLYQQAWSLGNSLFAKFTGRQNRNGADKFLNCSKQRIWKKCLQNRNSNVEQEILPLICWFQYYYILALWCMESNWQNSMATKLILIL